MGIACSNCEEGFYNYVKSQLAACYPAYTHVLFASSNITEVPEILSPLYPPPFCLASHTHELCEMMRPEYRYHHLLRSGRQTLPATFKELQAFLPRLEEHAEACKQLSLPIAVMQAGSDTLIMPQQVQASAELFGVEPITLPDVAHDLMLVSHLCLSSVSSWQGHVLQG